MHNHTVEFVPMGFKLCFFQGFGVDDQAAFGVRLVDVPVFLLTLQFFTEEIFVETERIRNINAVAEFGSVGVESLKSHYQDPRHYQNVGWITYNSSACTSCRNCQLTGKTSIDLRGPEAQHGKTTLHCHQS